MTKEVDLVIVGAGPAGCSAAIYAKRGGLNAALIGGSFPGGQLLQTNEIENYLGFPEVVDGHELVTKMHKHCARLGIEIVKEDVVSVDASGRPFIVSTKQGTVYKALAVIAATGSRARWLGAAGESKYAGKGVSACATCDGFFYRGKEVCVVGGGNTALESALFLAQICTKVHLIHRREGFRAEFIAVQKARQNPKIEFHTNAVIDEVLGDEHGVTGVRIKSVSDEKVTAAIPCTGLFVAAGSAPITDYLAMAGVELHDDGHIRADVRSRTNVEGIFAAGDCADPLYHQAIVAAGSGAKAAIEAINYVNLHK